MQEEVEQKTVNLAVTTTRLTGRVAVKAIAWYLRHRHEKKMERAAKANAPKHGKQTVKELIGQNAGVSSMDISKTGLKDFERCAKKYNVDFAVLVDKKAEPPKYTILFKARDADALSLVMKDYMEREAKNKNKGSVLKELQKMKEIVASLPKKIKEKIKEHSR